MKRVEYPVDIQDGWRSYPIRVTTHGLSECCQKPKVLVRSMPRGYVTANCAGCNKPYTISLSQFRSLYVWVSCPECTKQMAGDYVPPDHKNYGFVCHDCQLFIWFADLMPDWKQNTTP